MCRTSRRDESFNKILLYLYVSKYAQYIFCAVLKTSTVLLTDRPTNQLTGAGARDALRI